jgi:F-type H+-transporting ATPase subunit delta
MAEARQEMVFDTGQQYLGSVYAKALIGAGEKAGNTEQLLTELDSIVYDVLQELPALAQTLESPRVPLEAKERVLTSAFGGKATAPLLDFLKVVARRGRFDCLPAIAKSARHQFNQARGRVEVLVQSAETLDEKAIEELTSTLKKQLGREVELQLGVDAELIGGLVVRVGDTVYDGSLSNRLGILREEMIKRAGQQVVSELDRFAVPD